MQIGRYTITLKETTWWEDEEIKGILAGGAKLNTAGLSGFNGSVLLESKIKVFETCIKEIKEGEKAIPFSINWMKGLTKEEGVLVEQAIDELSKKK